MASMWVQQTCDEQMTSNEQETKRLAPLPGHGAHNAMWMPLIHPERVRLYRKTLIVWPERQTLYHYTTIPAFFSIISGQGLWASHIAYMNDASEIHHGRTFACEVIERLAGKARHQSFRHVLFQVIEAIAKKMLPDLYICCFSKARDDLSQWRAYGSTAGVCLGLPYPDVNFRIGTLSQMNNVFYDKKNKNQFDKFCYCKIRS